MDRRRFLATSTFAALGATTGLRFSPVMAQDGSPMGVAAARSFPIGGATVTALSDGFLPITPEALIGVTPEEFASLLEAAHLPGEAHPTGVNAYLVEAGGTRVLIDTGTGTAMGPGLGQLAANMAALGIDPASIETIVATHLHPDHVGGALTDAGNPFSKAGLKVHAADLDFWTGGEVRKQAPAEAQGFFDIAENAVAGFGERVETFEDGADLGHGMTAMHLPGHTVGHSGVMLESEGDALLIWGDIVHVPPVQFAMPEVTIGFDTDQPQAAATRAALLDQVATDGTRVAGMHIGFPGIGWVEKRSEGYGFTPAPFPYG
ncbi:MBL fold metallo-hydrolase [Vannielia litorea]|uniref:MBL fold metallo-hydrolase n=1 Tax=Vannielia litorea TaxID=1217970 RepID=UPI001BD0FE6E|nr:MBL fold metallo-hydrolase [Vannielia litorea]MBS8225965.1 MBL fold metallo-hydrolase [Vannielia litorea]